MRSATVLFSSLLCVVLSLLPEALKSNQHERRLLFDEERRWVHFTTESGLPSNVVHAVAETEDGTPWVATSSFSKSALLTVISITCPVTAPTYTRKKKCLYQVVAVGASEIWKSLPLCHSAWRFLLWLLLRTRCVGRVEVLKEGGKTDFFLPLSQPSPTFPTGNPLPACKTCPRP